MYELVQQFEHSLDALRREPEGDIGVDIEGACQLRLWHFYRRERSAETEILGMTFSVASR